MARRQLFRDGRVPELLSDPTEVQRLQLAALVALRANDLAEAAKNAAAAEEARPAPPAIMTTPRSMTCATRTTCWPATSRC